MGGAEHRPTPAKQFCPPQLPGKPISNFSSKSLVGLPWIEKQYGEESCDDSSRTCCWGMSSTVKGSLAVGKISQFCPIMGPSAAFKTDNSTIFMEREIYPDILLHGRSMALFLLKYIFLYLCIYAQKKSVKVNTKMIKPSVCALFSVLCFT